MSRRYTGEIDRQLLRHGKGKYRYPNTVFRFDGEWEKGCKSGSGVFTVAGGSTYEGYFKSGEIEGKGTKTWPEGRRYEGYFKQGEACGEGCFTSPTTGEKYIGTWVENKRHGQGELVLPHGKGTYVGEFCRHRYHGDGRLLLTSGFQYSGKFCDGLPHGLGDAIYPGGSSFRGPFEMGKINGSGGKYICGATGINFEGKWAAGKMVQPLSKWAVEVDSTNEDNGEGIDKTETKPGRKSDKSGTGVKSKSKTGKENISRQGLEGGDVDNPVVVQFNSGGEVAGLWCRCTRDAQITNIPELPPEHRQDGEDTPRLVTGQAREVVYEESGRTLAVTLHEVLESSPGSIGAPVIFFVRRPSATDVSESLCRFPIDGLVALFQREKRCCPKGFDERLTINSGVEAVELEPEPPTRDKSAPKSKGKGEQSFGDNAVEIALKARWQAIRGEKESNRCLILGAGKRFSLLAPRLFEPEIAATEGKGSGTRVEEETKSPGIEVLEKGDIQEVEDKNDSEAVQCPPNERADELLTIAHSSPFTVCIDFFLSLDLGAFEDDDSSRAEENNIEGDSAKAPEKIISIISRSKSFEVCAVVRPLTPPILITTDTNSVKEVDSTEGQEKGAALGTSTPAVPLQSDSLKGRGSAMRSSTISINNEPESKTVWCLHAISVRSGPFLAIAPCANRAENQRRKNFLVESASGTDNLERENYSYDLDSWHTLALTVNKEDKAPVLWIDGKVFSFEEDNGDLAGAICNEAESTSDGIVIGGPGGQWATLAVKNLAVYSKALDDQQLSAITRVLSIWREEKGAAEAADVLEDGRWVEEARKAAEEEREVEKRPEWVVGAEAMMSLKKKTFRGEAKINNIVLPKAALAGGEWVLRVEDASHDQTASMANEISTEANTEERETFPPLPTETIKLEQAS